LVASKRKENLFAQRIRARRRGLDITQEEVARRIGTSTPYVGHLESGKRHPSEKIVIKLADILGIDRAELFLLANPEAEAIIAQSEKTTGSSAWEEFSSDRKLHRLHNITAEEMEVLSRLALMGNVRSPRDFLFVLNAIRQAFGR
jgi:transcriptional regulator with XRE-family HTH domain